MEEELMQVLCVDLENDDISEMVNTFALVDDEDFEAYVEIACRITEALSQARHLRALNNGKTH